jgi:hypothetical protein
LHAVLAEWAKGSRDLLSFVNLGSAPISRSNRMREIHFIVEESPEGGYVARAVGAAVFTEADDLSSLHEQVAAPSAAISSTSTGPH